MTGFALIASVVDGFHCVAFAMTLHLVVPYKKYYMFFIGMFHFAFLIQNGRTIALPSYSLFTIHSSLFTIHYSLFTLPHFPFSFRIPNSFSLSFMIKKILFLPSYDKNFLFYYGILGSSKNNHHRMECLKWKQKHLKTAKLPPHNRTF